jgi:hypothetical protein
MTSAKNVPTTQLKGLVSEGRLWRVDDMPTLTPHSDRRFSGLCGSNKNSRSIVVTYF